ncbi:hypothetical protein QN277_018854 [Acacia crassicarpa]|uniref:MaoC-like domain-containing protein n=1 Tax=Acacia crassicarpa TaxID=499986 RepID=A0AAE1JS60_9FABA|nr:hypothetical protein QN277_018854 [Acacia crassicarpa]
MLARRLLSSRLQSLRPFSSETPRVLKPGDVLRQTRIFTDEDVLQYSKVSHDSNPLHFDSEAARNVGFEGRLVHGMLVASLFPHIISSHFIISEVQTTNLRVNKNRYLAKFKTSCFKNGELLVLEGEALALLQTLIMEEGHCKEQ